MRKCTSFAAPRFEAAAPRGGACYTRFTVACPDPVTRPLARRPTRALACLGLVAGLLLLPLALRAAQSAAGEPTRADAEALRQKIVRIRERPSAAPEGSLRTTIGQRELTAWLTFIAPEYLPTGVVDPAMSMDGEGRLSGSATVDLDAVRMKRQSGSWLDPVNLLRGSLAISALGTLEARDGVARFFLESAYVGRIPIPKSVLQQIVSYYTASEEDPDGVGLDEPYSMPAGIREIRVEKQQALVVQ